MWQLLLLLGLQPTCSEKESFASQHQTRIKEHGKQSMITYLHLLHNITEPPYSEKHMELFDHEKALNIGAMREMLFRGLYFTESSWKK